jgi:hypothetical protein
LRCLRRLDAGHQLIVLAHRHPALEDRPGGGHGHARVLAVEEPVEGGNGPGRGVGQLVDALVGQDGAGLQDLGGPPSSPDRPLGQSGPASASATARTGAATGNPNRRRSTSDRMNPGERAGYRSMVVFTSA